MNQIELVEEIISKAEKQAKEKFEEPMRSLFKKIAILLITRTHERDIKDFIEYIEEIEKSNELPLHYDKRTIVNVCGYLKSRLK